MLSFSVVKQPDLDGGGKRYPSTGSLSTGSGTGTRMRLVVRLSFLSFLVL
jgi:hypothetical protein